MKLENDKIIQGLFKYNEDITFTRGDFVVEGDKLYIVTTDSIKPGTNPMDGEGYELYQGNNVVEGLNDVVDYYEGNNKDKVLTPFSLGRILNSYLSGFDEKGIVRDNIGGDSVLRNYFFDSSRALSSNPLDDFMKFSDLNNAVLLVEENLVSGIIGTPTGKIMLRQYTYETNGERVRVQELTDLGSGMTMFRNSPFPYEVIGSWTCTNPGGEVMDKINTIIGYYNERIREQEDKLKALTSCYRFKSYPIVRDQGTLTINTSSLEGYNKHSIFMITICLQKKEGLIAKAESLTVDLKDNSTYETTLGRVTINNGTIQVPEGVIIKDLYYKQYFKND